MRDQKLNKIFSLFSAWLGRVQDSRANLTKLHLITYPMSKSRFISLFHLQVIATTLPKALFYCRLTPCEALSSPSIGGILP
jgi:hypothetical protein